MKHYGDCLAFHAVNGDESYIEDKMCFCQNNMHICNPSNDMDFTEPLHGTLLNFKQTGLLANETGVAELSKSDIGLQQNWNSKLSSGFYQRLDETEQIDMTLTGTLPHVHMKAHEKSEENFRSCVAKPDFLVPMSSRKEVGEVNPNQTHNAKISSRSKTELLCRLNHKDISIPVGMTDKLSDLRQIYSKAVGVDRIEFIHKKQQTQTPKIQEETSPVCDDVDMELTGDIKWNEIYYPEAMNRFVGNMELSGKTPQIQTSNPIQIYSRTGTVTDMQLTSGIKQNELCSAVHMSKDISDEELTCQWPQKQVSNPIGFPSHTGNETDMELTSGIRRTETCDEVGVKRYVSDMERRSERPQKQMVRQIYLSGDGNASDMELTNTIEQRGMSKEVEAEKYVNNMELIREIAKEMWPVDISSHGDVTDMELTTKLKKTYNAVEVNRCVSDLELTNEKSQKRLFKPTGVPRHVGDVSNMELTCGRRQKETCNAVQMKYYVSDLNLANSRPQNSSELSRNGNVGDVEPTNQTKQKQVCRGEEVRKYVNNMAVTSEMTQEEMSCPVDLSTHGDVTVMELTSGMKWKEAHNAVEAKRCVNVKELPRERPQKEISNPTGLSSLVHSDAGMKLARALNWKETRNAIEMNRHVSDMALTTVRPQKEIFKPLDASNDGNVSDMELTSGVKWEKTHNAVEMNRNVSDMTLTSEGLQREIFNPLDLSKHGNVSDMELTSGVKWEKTHNAVEMNRNVSDMTLTSEGLQREIFNPLDLSKHGNVSDMELTSGMKWNKTHNALEMNRNVSDMALTSEGPQREVFNPMDLSNHGNVSDMELTSGVKWKKMHNALEINRNVSDMALTSEGLQRELFNPLNASNPANVSDMELTSGVKWKKTHNAVEMNRNVSDMAVTSEGLQRELFNPLDGSNHGNISHMELTSGMRWKKTHNAIAMNLHVSDMAPTSEGPQREIFNPLDASNHGNISDMELTSGMRWKKTHNPMEMNRKVSEMALASEGPQEEIFNPLDASNHSNVSDMELTSGMKWKKTHGAVDMNRHFSDMSLTSEGPQKEFFNPLDASNDGNVSDMELTSGMWWKKTHNAIDMNLRVSDMAPTSEGPQKEIFNPLDASNHGNISDMELTSGMWWKKTHNAIDMNLHVSDMAPTSEGPQREIFNPLDASNHGNISDMELTSGMRWKKTHNPAEMNRKVSDMALTSDGPQGEIFNSLDASNHGNVSDMELTSGMKWKKTHNPAEMNRKVSDMALTSDGPQGEIFNPLDASNHGNVSDMELTSGMKWKKIHGAVDMNRHFSDVSLTSEGPQKEFFNPVDASNDGNVSDMELTSGMQWIETFKLGEVNQSVTDMEVRNEKRWKQTSSPIVISSRNKVSDMELRTDGKRKEIFNVGDVSDMEQSDRGVNARSAVCADVDDLGLRNEVKQMNVELTGINPNGNNNQLHVFCTYANSSNTESIDFVHHKKKDIHTDTCNETKNISGIPTMPEVPKLSFDQISNIDGKKLSKHKKMGDVARMSYHSLQPMNVKQSYTAMLLHNDDSEDTERHSELEVCISPCGDTNADKACQSDHRKTKTSPRHTILSEESTVETLDNLEKFHAQDNSLTVVNQVEVQYNNLPFSEASLASIEGRYCEQGMSEVEGINESVIYKRKELQVENFISAKNSVTAVSLNLSNPLNTKKLGNISNECDILKLNQGSVNRNIKNTVDKSGHLQGKYDTENLDSSSNELKKVSPLCQLDNRTIKENLNLHQQLIERSTYTSCATGAIKELAIGFDSLGNTTSSNTDSIGNAASHNIQEVQYARKRVQEKTHSQDSLVENTQMFKSHNSNSLLLEQVDGKQGHASVKPASYECVEASDLHLQTPPKWQALPTVEQPRNVTPANSAIKELAIGFDSVGNATSSNTDSVGNPASHDIQEVQYARKRVHEKTHSQGSLVENTQMFKSHNSNLLLLEEVDGKQGHASVKPASYECVEASDLHMQTPPKWQALPTVEQPRNVTPANSIEPLEINQNLSYLEIENTSIPEELEFNIIRDLSPETDESYKKLLGCVSVADERVHEKVSTISNEGALLGNSQDTRQNYKNRTSLVEEVKNNENTLDEPGTRGQKGSPGGTPVKSSSKQMCEHSESQKLREDANEEVTTASVQKKIKEEELRLVMNCDLPFSMSDVVACLISICISSE